MIKKLYKYRQILILSGRRNHLNYLKNETDKIGGITTGFYVGGGSGSKKKKKELEESETKNVIFGTFEMAREGLDIPSLNTLILASPVSDAEQAVGRVLRLKTDINPVIIDIVDCFSIFRNMGNKRKSLYKKSNFSIMNKEIKVKNDFTTMSDDFDKQLEEINFDDVYGMIENNVTKKKPKQEKLCKDISMYFNEK